MHYCFKYLIPKTFILFGGSNSHEGYLDFSAQIQNTLTPSTYSYSQFK